MAAEFRNPTIFKHPAKAFEFVGTVFKHPGYLCIRLAYEFITLVMMFYLAECIPQYSPKRGLIDRLP